MPRREWPRSQNDSGEENSGYPAKRQKKKGREQPSDVSAETQEAENLLDIYRQLLTSETDLGAHGNELPPDKKSNLELLLEQLTAEGLLNDPRAVEIREEAAARREQALERRHHDPESNEPELAGETRERPPGAGDRVPFEPPSDTTATDSRPADLNPEETAAPAGPGMAPSADPSPQPADNELPPQGRPFSFEEENLIAEATWDLAKRQGVYRGEAYELLLKTIGRPAEPLARESLNRIVDELAPPSPEPAAVGPQPEPTAVEAEAAAEPAPSEDVPRQEAAERERADTDVFEADLERALNQERALAASLEQARMAREFAEPVAEEPDRKEAKPERPTRRALATSFLKHLGAAAANTAGSLLGVKVLYDFPAWIRETHALKRERREMQVALIEMTRGFKARRREKKEGRKPSKETADYAEQTIRKFKDAVRNAKHLAPKERLAYRKRLRAVTAKHRKLETELNGEENERIANLSKLYLTNKISGYRVAREALNTALVLGGMPMFRGAAYAATAMLERGAKAGREFEKANWDADHAPSFWAKKIAQTKDVFITSTLETARALTLRAEKGQRAAKFVEAAGKLATGYGIGYGALQGVFEMAPTEGITKLLDAFEHEGASGVAHTTATNFWKNFNDMAARFTTLRLDRAGPGVRGSTAGVSLSDEVRGIEAAAVPTHDASPYEEPSGIGETSIKTFQETAPTEPIGLNEHEIQQLRETASIVAAETPAPTLESLAESPIATIEQGSNVWDTAKRLVAEEKITPQQFFEAWEHSVRTLPDLVHRGDLVKFISGDEKMPAHFEVIAESGLPTGSAKNLAEIYERLGKEVPPWLQEKIEPSPSLPTRVAAAIEVPQNEVSAYLADIRTDFVRGDLAKQTAAIHQLQDMRESLEFAYRDAAGSPEQTEIREHLERLDAIRHELTYTPEYAAQTKAFESLLADTEVPEVKRALLKTLTVDRLLAERHSSQFFDLNALTQRIERYLAIIPSRERPRELTVETFLQKFVVGGKFIAAA